MNQKLLRAEDRTKLLKQRVLRLAATRLLGEYECNADDFPSIALVKFFTPDTQWAWWASEAEEILEDGEVIDIEFFGLVHGFEAELGYFLLSELQSVRGKFGLPIERDMHWTPCDLMDLWERERAQEAMCS
jgi:hypothetical protein